MLEKVADMMHPSGALDAGMRSKLDRLKFIDYHIGRMMHADFRDADYFKLMQKPSYRKDESPMLWNQAIEEAVAEYN